MNLQTYCQTSEEGSVLPNILDFIAAQCKAPIDVRCLSRPRDGLQLNPAGSPGGLALGPNPFSIFQDARPEVQMFHRLYDNVI